MGGEICMILEQHFSEKIALYRDAHGAMPKKIYLSETEYKYMSVFFSNPKIELIVYSAFGDEVENGR